MLVALAVAAAFAGGPSEREPVSEEEPASEGILVLGQAPAASAGERTLVGEELGRLPGQEVEDLLRALPGMHISGHGGQGKAPQYLLRGFDAGHGADIAGSIEGVPLNIPSHPHGHGYLDLHIVPPALVRSLALRPGPFRLDAGDHAVAGSVDIGLGMRDQGLWGAGRLGSNRSGGATLAFRPAEGQDGDFVLAEVDAGAGQGQRRWFQQARGGVGVQRGAWRAWCLALEGRYASPGVLLADEVRSGDEAPTSAWPVVGGGRARRVVVAGQTQTRSDRARLDGRVWAQAHRVDIEQNTTGWLRDPVNGDGIRQAHQGRSAGGRLVGRLRGPVGEAEAAVAARVEQARAVALAIDGQGRPLVDEEPVAQGSSELAGWLGLVAHPRPWVRAAAGLRAARIGLWQEDRGAAWAPVLLPKLGLGLGRDIQGIVNYAQGYRSPEVGGLSEAERAPISKVDALEIGLRRNTDEPGVSGRVIAFASWVDEEILFDHLSARFISGQASRRLGLEASAGVAGEAGAMELQGVGVDARFVAAPWGRGGEAVPYAPRTMGALLGHLVLHGRTSTQVHGRLWALGPRPLPDGFRAGPRAGLDLGLSIRGGRWGLSLDGENLLPGPAVEGEFVYASRPSPEDPSSALPRLHWTLGEARVLRAEFQWRFG